MAVKPYRIEDEPQPGAMAQVAVDPLWPLLGLMFVGAWFSWPWFVVNGFAVGSPTRWRELAWVIGGFVVSAAIILGIFYVMDQEILQRARKDSVQRRRAEYRTRPDPHFLTHGPRTRREFLANLKARGGSAV